MQNSVFIIILLLSSLLQSAIAGDVSTCKQRKLCQFYPFPIGLALDTEKLKYEEVYWNLALSEFSSFTPEQILKASYIHPRENKFMFTEIDELMRFCKERRIRLHGHTLIWHREIPSWMYRKKGSKSEDLETMKQHIDQLVRHCAGKITGWDVLNEAFNEDGTLRENLWFKRIGPDYISEAFRAANTADSSALLFYNDYGLEVPGPKLNAVLKTLTSMRQDGVRIDGIGLQLHITIDYPSKAALEQACRQISEAGFMIHFSEVDIRVTGQKSSKKKQRELLETQANRFATLFQLYRSLPKRQQYGITIWGLSDADTWLNENNKRSQPLLFDEKYRPKPAYCKLTDTTTRN